DLVCRLGVTQNFGKSRRPLHPGVAGSPRALCRRPLRGLVQSFQKHLSSKLTHYSFSHQHSAECLRIRRWPSLTVGLLTRCTTKLTVLESFSSLTIKSFRGSRGQSRPTLRVGAFSTAI